MNKPLVSVCMITYNHEDYILQAIYAILKQKTTFDIEFVIANDASNDNTDFHIEETIQANPHINFKYFNNSANKGMRRNFLFALSACAGKYIALCEGDDYWTDPLKLQKQVDFLEIHPEFELCFTNVNIIDAQNKVTNNQLIKSSKKTVYTHTDMPIWAPTLTRVFKNRDFTNLPEAPGMDTLMLVYQSTLGKIKFLDETTGTYRVHGTGVYTSQNKHQKKIHSIETLLACLPVIESVMVKKYAGMILKLFLDLKKMNKKLFIENKKKYFAKVIGHMGQQTVTNKAKIWACYYLILVPFIYRSKSMIALTKKIISKVLIYQ